MRPAFFENQGPPFLVSSRHVIFDRPSRHFPDRIEIELHVDADNMVRSTAFSIPLCRQGRSLWRAGPDSSGNIDPATIELDRNALPASVVCRAGHPVPSR